jgi:exodeoxyribonuclease-5
MTWSPQQDKALMEVARWLDDPSGKPVFRLFGFAGTGKTTLAVHFANAFGGDVMFAAFTGKAALVMRRKGCTNASTIHSLIYKPIERGDGTVEFERNYDSDLRGADLLIVDECSMVGPDLGRDLLSFGVPILVLGDPAQLPPVNGAGFFTDHEPDVMLTEVHRQARDNPIIRVSMDVREERKLTPCATGPCRIIPRAALMRSDVLRADQVLVGLNKTRTTFNALMREMRGLASGWPLPGDKLVCLRNDRERGLLNGGLWRVSRMLRSRPAVLKMIVAPEEGDAGAPTEIAVHPYFFAGREAELAWEERKGLQEFTYGYALTVHKCVTGDTLVETGRGIERIADALPFGMVATGDGMRPYSRKFSYPATHTLLISCEDGYASQVTLNHKMEVWRDGFRSMVDAEKVVIGDWMRVRLGAEMDQPHYVELPVQPKGDVRALTVTIPRFCDESVGEFLGLMVADGTLFQKGFRLLKRHKDVADRFGELIRDIFHVTPHRVAFNNAVGRQVSSTILAAWLDNLGGLSPHKKSIPPCIMASPLSVQAAFLRGLFEDGTVNVKNGACDHIEWSTCVDDVARSVQVLLLRFGVICSLTRRRDQTMIYIYGKSAAAFRDKIGFVAAFKRRRLKVCRTTERRYRIPLNRNAFDAARSIKITGISQADLNNFRVNGYVSREKIRAWTSKHDIEFLSDRLLWHWVRVQSIEDGHDDVYCLEVPEVHRFLQNGFPHGNSQGSQWDDVVLFNEGGSFREDAQRWLYTGVTRAAKTLTVVM